MTLEFVLDGEYPGNNELPCSSCTSRTHCTVYRKYNQTLDEYCFWEEELRELPPELRTTNADFRQSLAEVNRTAMNVVRKFDIEDCFAATLPKK